MQEKEDYPIWLVTRIWFLANCILTLLLLSFALYDYFKSSNYGDSLSIYFGAIFIGFFISIPSLILLFIANGFYSKKRFPNLSVKKYMAIDIVAINFIYLCFTYLFTNMRGIESLVFYILTTVAGLLSLYLLTKNYFPENEY